MVCGLSRWARSRQAEECPPESLGKGGALPPAGEGTSPSSTDQVQRLRVRYAKRGRMRFASHRDIARALERAFRRARLPVASSQGFTPHPKVSYAGAAPTGVASEAEYLELTLTEPREAERTRSELDAALPTGLDVLDVTPLVPGEKSGFAGVLEASDWRIELPGVGPAALSAAVAEFLGRDQVEVERVTKKGRRTVDVRGAILGMGVEKDPHAEHPALRVVTRQGETTVRPDDVVTALRSVAGLAPPSPPRVTRLAQGLESALTPNDTQERVPAKLRADTADSGDGV